MDLFAGSDRRVVAPESGVVVAVANGSSPPWSGFGPGVVVIRGGSGVFHLLSHLEFSSIRVGIGLPVSEGTLIGQYDARIAHTHYEVRRELTGPSAENTVDPSVWLKAQGGSSGGLGKLVLLAGLFGAGVYLSRRLSPA
jgi:murein DD-endopeptidase MepM/ murein hydrolase activator NlpD